MNPHPARTIPTPELLARLRSEVAAGRVFERTRGHLSLFGYTDRCVYERAWNETNILARGLIIDTAACRVVATPFPKFFNYGEGQQTIPNESFEVFEKLDGSLIIAFFTGSRWNAATRGSFDSGQAKWAQSILDQHPGAFIDLEAGDTLLFEAIYPANRVVVPYDYEGLVLLGGYWSSGKEMDAGDLAGIAGLYGFRQALSFSFDSLADMVTHCETLPATSEGFVVRFASGLRLKFKGAEYRRIHALISRVTPLALWECMKAGDDLDAMRREIPEEFWGDFDAISMRLHFLATDILAVAQATHWSCRGMSKKEVGLALSTLPQQARPFIFALMDGKDIETDPKLRETLFRAIRPTGNRLEGYTPSVNVLRMEVEA